MDKYQRLKESLQLRRQIIGTNIMLIQSSPMLQLINEDYLDYVLFDMEHGVFNNENLIPMLQTCRLIGLPSFVRVPEHTSHHIARCLDLGADGIMLPRTQTVEQVKNAVQAMRFPPIGKKGRGGYCQLRNGETLEDFQKNRHLLVQIESRQGIDALDEMLSLYKDEIAAIIVGPYDLSLDLGMPAQFDRDEFQSAVKEIFDICKKHEKSVGIFCDNPTHAKHYRDMGANFLWVCTDDQIFKAGMKANLAPLAE